MASQSKESILLTTASFAAGVALCYSLLSHNSNNKTEAAKKKFDVPAEIANSSLGFHARVALTLALQAGGNMTGYCNEKGTLAESEHDLKLEFKGQPEDFCTKVDVENERLVTNGLREQFPDHVIIGEETCGTGEIPPLSSAPTWIIDPIDGTTNFAAGLPLTCVSIGFCQDGQPCLGVVYAPMTDELYIAVKGVGAFRNGVRIESQKPDTPLSRAVVCFEFGYAREDKEGEAMLGVVQKIMKNGCRAMRQIGSGVLDLCYVATGRLDVVYAGVASEGWKPWDFCAGLVVVQEAGCVIEAFDQKEPGPFNLYSKNHICATNRGLLEEVRALVL